MTARRKKKKRCQWCVEGVQFIDYKSVSRLQKFMDSKAKFCREGKQEIAQDTKGN
jgi:SSU ribosomal protein S18P